MTREEKEQYYQRKRDRKAEKQSIKQAYRDTMRDLKEARKGKGN